MYLAQLVFLSRNDSEGFQATICSSLITCDPTKSSLAQVNAEERLVVVDTVDDYCDERPHAAGPEAGQEHPRPFPWPAPEFGLTLS